MDEPQGQKPERGNIFFCKDVKRLKEVIKWKTTEQFILN